MTNEVAIYLKLLLKIGFHDKYFQYLERILSEEPKLSGILLELSFCGQDVNKAISCLLKHTYCEIINYDIVASMILEDFKELYLSKQISMQDLIIAMHIVAIDSEQEQVQPWRTMEKLYFDYDDGLEEMYPNDFIEELLTDFLLNSELME